MNGGSTDGPRIGYWIFNYEPRWEAASREVKTLAEWFGPVYGTRTISLSVRGWKPKLSGADKHLPLAWGLLGLPLLGRATRAVEVNHVFASPGERLLTPRLARLDRSILTITKQSLTLRGFEKNIGTLKTLSRVVVESARHQDLLIQVGVSPERVALIYPGVDRQPYRSASGPFTILFATSPRKHDLLRRGIYLMVKAAEALPSVTFRLVWRRNPEEVRRLLDEARLPNIELISGFVEDMEEQYDSAHTVILPALEYASLKPSPHSALQALAHGKPVLVSDTSSIAGVVQTEKCGVVFSPDVASLCAAIRELKRNYETYQGNAHRVLRGRFSTELFIERYARLYASLLDG